MLRFVDGVEVGADVGMWLGRFTEKSLSITII
jgi:hypothetical protein